MVKSPPATQETWIPSPDQEDPLEEGMATHSSIPARRIPWTEELGGLQSMGSQRVEHNSVTKQQELNKVTLKSVVFPCVTGQARSKVSFQTGLSFCGRKDNGLLQGVESIPERSEEDPSPSAWGLTAKSRWDPDEPPAQCE